MLPGKIYAQPVPGERGYCVTVETDRSRRTVQVPPQSSADELPPLAAESFALHPDAYHAMLQRVEALAKKGI
ncbi:MAG: hypothetical protein ACFB20_07655 [Opitutales bacterium]